MSVLTSSLPRPIAVVGGLVLAALAACQRHPAPSVVTPEPPPPPLREVPAVPARFVVPEPSLAPLRLDVRTWVVSSDRERRDSTLSTADLVIDRDPRGLVAHVMQNDSTGRLDSLPPIATDRSGRWSTTRLVLPCRDLGLLPSPLIVRLLQPRAATNWPVSDSLSYSVCSRGAARTVSALVTWLEPEPTADRITYEQGVRITGVIQGDSTRAFPMRMSGALRGEARLQVTATEGRLVKSSGTLTIDLTAAANAMRQQAAQVVTFTAGQRP